ncbi:MAG TPA: hypothetical protein VIZ28_09180 [Chitinophagaceae bacterium]
MKRVIIVQAAVLVAVVAVLAGCGSNRDYHGRHYPSNPPPARVNTSLIISSSPGLVVLRHPNGMYYYRDQRGFIYWRGYGNQYYLDRRYVNKSHNGHSQYHRWKRYHNYGRSGRR